MEQHLEVVPSYEPDGRIRLALAGDLDLGSVPEVARSLDAYANERRAVVLDIRGLRFIDSSGVRLLLRSSRSAEADGWDFRITRPTGEVARVLEVLGIEPMLALEDRG